jgi:hypothetical protein
MVMNAFTLHPRRRAARLFFALLVAFTPVAFSQYQPPAGNKTPIASSAAESPSAFARPKRVRKPIPLQWKIAIVAAVLIIGALVLARSARAWRASNLFGREYRFPPPATVAFRLGAKRSGGLMATISFRERAGPEFDSGIENL